MDGPFWSKVLRILFFSIDSIICSIFLSIVLFVVFVFLVVLRVKSYVQIISEQERLIFIMYNTNHFGTEEVISYYIFEELFY